MKTLARFVILVIAWFFICAIEAIGQVQWTLPHTVEVPWISPNGYGHSPENPPTQFSDPILVPIAPDGTDYVRVTVEAVRYAAVVECVNLSPIGHLSYELTGLYSYHYGHAPGLYAGDVGDCGFPAYLVGGGDPLAQRIGDVVSGSMSYFTTCWFGQTRIDDYVHIDDGGPVYPVNIFQTAISPQWLVPSRRDPTKHAIYLTSEGDFYMRWLVHDIDGSFMTDAEVDAMFSHLPWATTVTPRVSSRFTIQYGSF